VPGMQQVEAAADEDNALPVVFPFAPLENQAVLRDHLSQFAAPLTVRATREKSILSRAPSRPANPR